MNSRLQAVRAFGQGIWLDNLSRELWQSGALKQWIEQDGIVLLLRIYRFGIDEFCQI